VIYSGKGKIRERRSRTAEGRPRTRFRSAPLRSKSAWWRKDVIDTDGRSSGRANQKLTTAMLAKIMEAGIHLIHVFFPDRDEVGNVVSMTLKKDPIKVQKEALIDIYRKASSGRPPTLDTATQLFQGMFFDRAKYDLRAWAG